MSDLYEKALSVINGVGEFIEPSARMLIGSYYSNPILHPISKHKTDLAEDRFKDSVASLNLLEDYLKEPGSGVYPNGVTRVEDPTFIDKWRAAQLQKHDLATKKNPLAYKYGDEKVALDNEKRKIKYARPKYY